MIIEPMIVTDKIGRSIVLRNAEEDDAASLIKFMKITTGETPFLIREPDEFSLTIEQEKIFDIKQSPLHNDGHIFDTVLCHSKSNYQYVFHLPLQSTLMLSDYPFVLL